MPRARNIKPSFFTSDQLAECSDGARLLFAGLWTLADREGRLEHRPLRIKAEIFPYDQRDVVTLLAELAGAGLIKTYQCDGFDCIWIPTFLKHQNPHKNEKPSTLPPYEESRHYAKALVKACTAPAESISGFLNPFPEELPTEACGEPPTAASPPPADDSPTVAVFPVKGPSKTWKLSRARVDRWREHFPDLDVEAELRLALAWCEDNPARRKTANGMPAFLGRWLAKVQNSGRGQPRDGPAKPARQSLEELVPDDFLTREIEP